MTFMDTKAIFKTSSTAATSFAQASRAWRTQVAAASLDQDDQALLADLAQIEEDFTKWGKRPVPADTISLRNSYVNGDTLLTKAKDIYTSLSGVSQTPEIQTKETEARKSLKQFSKAMKAVQDQFPSESTGELLKPFLCIMQDLIEQGPEALVTQDDFNFTQKLFNGETPSLDDTQLNHLTNSWTVVVDNFVQNGHPGCSFESRKADFLIMHSQLETLYNRIADPVVTARSVGSRSLVRR
jgi:hypothetical protein